MPSAKAAVAATVVAVLVYAALSGTQGAHGLGAALLASVAFLLVSVVLATLWRARSARAGTESGTAVTDPRSQCASERDGRPPER